MQIQGAHHIALKTANYAALREFYTSKLVCVQAPHCDAQNGTCRVAIAAAIAVPV